MSPTRREFLWRAGIGALAVGGLLSATPVRAGTDCRRVNGAGSYRLGPFDPVDPAGEPVFLVADLGFDETMVFCKVTTNFAPLRFPTAQMGVVNFGAHEFFMDMRSVRVNSLEIREGDDGPQAIYEGVLRSETRLGAGEQARTIIEEEILFGCDVVAFGPDTAAEISTTNFVMTAQFDPRKEHAAIFGEQATFAGLVTEGNIMIVA